MSDSKRATLITVGATKNEKTKVNKTVRLTINLVESNESKYPELNYKELVIAEECKNRDRVENGKTDGLNPFSDNDDDVERVARKFEQKYGGKSTYGRKGRSKRDDFADIGAGYDENDSFIDNTDGYDEMIPPECDTLYGGFYINSGSLEFKNVDRSHSDEEQIGRRNKRRISSSSSEDESSSSSSAMESADDKQTPRLNGDAHHNEHRKKKNKKIEKKKAKKIRRTDSSAATSGKQTSDDNNHGDGESDSRTSQSDSLTSKPAPSSENPITSDSSRDVDGKLDVCVPSGVITALEELEAAARMYLMDKPNMSNKEIETKLEPAILRLERLMSLHNVSGSSVRACWSRAARAMRCSKAVLLQRAGIAAIPAALPANAAKAADVNDTSTPTQSAAVSVIQASRCESTTNPTNSNNPTTNSTNPTTNSTNPTTNSTNPTTHKRSKQQVDADVDYSTLTEDEREAKIVETLQRLKALIEERKPGMMANYNAECERVQEERKKIQIASAAEGAPHIEKRLPKRRFPWCNRTRDLLARLVRLANAGSGGGSDGGNDGESGSVAASLLARRALPLFPPGFVRMPTLLRQADLSKELKANEMKRQRLGSTSQPLPIIPPIQFPEAIQFPSSLTVTTMKTSPEKNDPILDEKEKLKAASIFGSIINSFTLAKDIVDKQDDRKKDGLDKKDDLYIPPNNIGSITITPVPSSQHKDKKVNSTLVDKQKEGLIRIKSPAALNEMVHKQEKVKALENIHKREKDKLKKEKLHSQNHSVKNKVNEVLHIDTSYQARPKETTPSPKSKEEVTQKFIENLRISENNIPRPGLVPVHLSPTFAKPDKRPPEVKKKKEVVIVSDLDPLGEVQMEPLSVDDSSSDVEVVEDNKCVSESDSVPSKDKVSVRENHKDLHKDSEKRSDKLDDATKQEFDSVMKNLRDLEQHSQESPKFKSSSYGGVITSAKRDKSSNQSYNSRGTIFGDTRSDQDKLTNFFEQNGWM